MSLYNDGQPLVLIVDDDEDALEMTRRLVHRAEPTANVVLAQGAGPAMAYLLQASQPGELVAALPALILLDVNMPGTDGFELLRWIRRNQSLAGIKVVMLSTSESPADIKRATELGAHGFLIKYPNRAVLACVLHQVCRANQADGHGRPEPTAELGGNRWLLPAMKGRTDENSLHGSQIL
jgi:CheY-like chemotaxis protein